MTRPQIYRTLAKMYGFSPDTVLNMTPYQQLVYLQDDDSEAGVARFATVEEYQQWRRASL